MKIADSKMLNIASVLSRIEEYKNKLSTEEFFFMLKYLQYNMPYGEVKALRESGIENRLWREWSPVDGYMKPREDLDMFNSFIDKAPVIVGKGHSMFFYGNNASGKSYLALYIMAAYVELGFSGWYTHFKDYMLLFNAVNYKDSSDRRVLDHIYCCDLLVIDEVGKESSVTDNVLGEFERLLKARDNEGLPTIIITNLNVEDFGNRYGASVRSILDHKYRFIHFNKDNKFRTKTRLEWGF